MRTRTLGLWAIALLAAVGGVAVGLGALARLDGFSARATPSAAERIVARAVRGWAVPRGARGASNPVAFTSAVWAEGRAHFADHCATCHANDGSGQTEIGQNLYPKAPDMRLPDTQRLTDGELYWIIANGVRLTGMPAWGEGGPNDEVTWTLVHFVRHLSELTTEQLREMKALNPKTPEEIKEEQDDQDFLSGRDTDVSTGAPSHRQHKETP
ncbi:MAG: c-type cytochrome [Vicinamibacterales bacterium]